MSKDVHLASLESKVKKRNLKYDCPYGTTWVMMTVRPRL